MDFFCYKLLINRDFKLEKYNCYDENHIDFMSNFNINSKKSEEVIELKNCFIISINNEYKGYVWLSDVIRYNDIVNMKYILKKGISNKISSVSYMKEITDFIIKQKYARTLYLKPNGIFQRLAAQKEGFKKRYSTLLAENLYFKDEIVNNKKK